MCMCLLKTIFKILYFAFLDNHIPFVSEIEITTVDTLVCTSYI